MSKDIPFKEGQRVTMQSDSTQVGVVTLGPGCEADGLVCVFWGDDLLPTSELPESLTAVKEQEMESKSALREQLEAKGYKFIDIPLSTKHIEWARQNKETIDEYTEEADQ